MGSDVPFALLGGTAVGQGRGEQLTAALAAGTYHWVLAFAAGGLSTPEVYTTCDRLREARGAAAPALSTELMAALRSGDPAAVGPLLSNDLQPAAVSLRPDLRRALHAGRDLGALGAIVSGSGPTCAFLAANAGHARELAVSLTSAGVCRGVVRVQGPAAWRRRGHRGAPVSPAQPLVTLEAAAKAYGPRVLLDGVSLGVAAGDRIGVVGRNGAGKTTLLAALAGPGRAGFGPGHPGPRPDRWATCRRPTSWPGTVRQLVFGTLPGARVGRGPAQPLGHRGPAGRDRPARAGRGAVGRRAAPGRAGRGAARRRTTCCCSTSRPTTSTSTRSAGWPATCASTAGPSSSSPTTAGSWTR